MVLEEKVKKLLEKPICDHCLGRPFAQLLTGLNNAERGRIIRAFGAMLVDAEKISLHPSNFKGFKFHMNEDFEKEVKKSKKEVCYFCGGVFEKLDKIAEKIVKKVKGYEFKTFLIGNKLSEEMIKKEEELWLYGGLEFSESLKAELNREIGKLFSEKTGKEHDPKKPDITITVVWDKSPKIELNVRSLYIFGYYQKLKRGFPQAKWGTPGKYRTSVEQIIGRPLLKETKGKDTKFHGAGREDVDARNLGWRAFVIEILEPKKRKVNLKKITEEINKSGKVKVKGLKIVEREVVEKVKSITPDKTYRVTVVFDKKVGREDLKKLKQLVGKIKQKTPLRVVHRRGEKIRIKEVKDIRWKILGPKKIELIIKASSGLYIKELVHGDKGRTKPSVAEILGVKAEPKDLDVIKIEKVKIL